jgi:sugar phosphate isomerase/epimerase
MKIALAGWSLNRRFRDDVHPFPLLSFPMTAKREFGIDAIELNNIFFASTEDEYLAMLIAKAEQAEVDMIGMAVDGTGDLSNPDEAERETAVTDSAPWLDIAAKLGLGWVRFNAGGQWNEESPEALNSCVRSLKELCKSAQPLGIRVLIENHWGISSCPLRMHSIMEAVGAENLGSIIDFGNFPAKVDRFDGIEKIAPRAVAVHVKTHTFDEHGESARIDMSRCIKILKAAKFKGHLCIEYEGEEDEREGILKSKALIEKHILTSKKA